MDRQRAAGFCHGWIGFYVRRIYNHPRILSGLQLTMMSRVPLSGGQYNWWEIYPTRLSISNHDWRVAVLAPPSCSKFLSYLTGMFTVIAWQTGIASAAFLGGTMIQGLMVLNYPNYVFQRWHGTLLFYAIIALSLFVNTYLARLLPMIESAILIIHVIGFFCILIPLVYLAPHGSAASVFQQLNNGGGWSTNGLSFFVGLTTSMFAFIGKHKVWRWCAKA